MIKAINLLHWRKSEKEQYTICEKRIFFALRDAVINVGFWYCFCRFTADKGVSHAKQIKKDIELINNDYCSNGRNTCHHACWC